MLSRSALHIVTYILVPFLTLNVHANSEQDKFNEAAASIPFPDFANFPAYSSPLTHSDSSAKIRLKLNCYGANLRTVANPLNTTNITSLTTRQDILIKTPGGKLKITIPNLFFIKDNSRLPYSGGQSAVRYIFTPNDETPTAELDPATITKEDLSAATPISLDTGSSTPNEIVLSAFSSSLFPSPDISTAKDRLQKFRVTKLIQKGAAAPALGTKQTYLGSNGTLSFSAPSPSISQVNNQLIITQNIVVPAGVIDGTEWKKQSICGSYYSPIMLSFQKRRPIFKAKVTFPIHPVFSKTYWPSTYNQNYFLAIDTNGDGKITNETEIFGDQLGRYPNGFTKLATLDDNRDTIIDRKDRSFSRLLLWQDTNRNGIGEKDELKSLTSMQVNWISLNYKDTNIRYRNATAKQIASFSYNNFQNKNTLGQAIDYWLKPAGQSKERKSSLATK